ncbi:MAG: YfhO family protein [Chloroflexi bacterium]|nr:YfhO family protein [Chloroflexota bacterium]
MNWIQREIKRYQLPLLALAAFAAIFYLPVLVTGRVFYWGLPVLQFYPWRAAAMDAVLQGALPLWNSSSGMGAPLLANYQLAFFYPPTWGIYLFAWVGGVQWMAWAHTLVNLAHFFIAGLGIAKLLGKHNGSPLAQSIGALAYSACGFFIARQGVFPILWTADWLPWLILYASDLESPFRKPVRQTHPAGWVHLKLTLVIAMLLLAGHAQLGWYFLWFAGAWIVAGGVTNRQNPFRSIIRYVLSGLLGGAIAAIQLIPTAEYLLQSQRASAVDFETAAAYSFWPWRWFTLLAPNFFGNPGTGDYWGYGSFWEDAVYIGILPLSLAVFSLVSLMGRKPQQAIPGRAAAWVGIALTAVFAMGKFTPVYPWLYQHIPSMDMFHAPTRIMVIAIFLLVFMGSLHADSGWTRPSGKGLYWARLATAGCVAVSMGSLAGWALLDDISPTFFRSTALAGLAATGIGFLTLYQPATDTLSRKRWEFAVVGLLVIDLWLAQVGSAPTMPMHNLNFTPFADGLEDVNARLYVSAQDEQWLRHKRFYRFQDFRFLEPAESVFRVPIANTHLLLGYSSVSNFDPLVSMRYQAWMDRLAREDEKALEADWMRMGVTHRLVRDVGLNEVLIQPVGTGSSFPGVRMTASVQEAGNAVEALAMVEKHAADASVVVFEAPENVLLTREVSGQLFAYEILALERSWNQFGIEYESEQEGYLVAAESYFPGWTASVDGLAVEVFPADGAFMGIQAPAGQHRVEFRYQPNSFRAGGMVTLLSLMITAAVFVGSRRKHEESLNAS